MRITINTVVKDGRRYAVVNKELCEISPTNQSPEIQEQIRKILSVSGPPQDVTGEILLTYLQSLSKDQLQQTVLIYCRGEQAEPATLNGICHLGDGVVVEEYDEATGDTILLWGYPNEVSNG